MSQSDIETLRMILSFYDSDGRSLGGTAGMLTLRQAQLGREALTRIEEDLGLSGSAPENIPVSEPTDLLCGHWTFFGLGDNNNVTARCDLPQGHEGLHKFWHNPATRESFSWSETYERHKPRETNDDLPKPP